MVPRNLTNQVCEDRKQFTHCQGFSLRAASEGLLRQQIPEEEVRFNAQWRAQKASVTLPKQGNRFSTREFKKKRALETEKLMLKHHNKFKEIDRATRDVPDNKAKSQYFY